MKARRLSATAVVDYDGSFNGSNGSFDGPWNMPSTGSFENTTNVTNTTTSTTTTPGLQCIPLCRATFGPFCDRTTTTTITTTTLDRCTVLSLELQSCIESCSML